MQIKGQPWFVAADVCRCLGLDVVKNTVTKFLTRLHATEFTRNRIATKRGHQRALVVSESGLYKLIMRSDKPEARKFQDWVTQEVLPAIRLND